MLRQESYIGTIPLFTDTPGGGGWERPAAWLALPDITGQDRVVGLFAVGDYTANYVAFRCAGATNIDWGDGSSIEAVAANITAQHNYTYSSLSSSTNFALAGTVDIHRQAIISIVPQAGQQLTSVSFDYKHSALGGARTKWLDITLSAPNATVVKFGGTAGNLSLLQRANVIAIGAMTSGSAFFQNCSSLASVPLFDLSAMTTGISFFNGCSSLASVPLFDLSSLVNGVSFFQSCSSLASVPLFDLSAMTNGVSFFQSCSSLASVPLFDLSSLVDGATFFNGCYSLASVPLFDLSAMTTGSAFLTGCSSLASVPLFDLSSLVNGANFFNNCYSLASVPLFDLSSLITGTIFFGSCLSLSRSRVTGNTTAMSYTYCPLGLTELVEIFTNLGTASGAQSITVTGCLGTPSLPAGDILIATSKGWTVVT